MGFTPETQIYKLTFRGTDLDGLEVRIGECTVGEFSRMVTPIADGGMNDKEGLDLLLKYLKSWNLEIPAGTPVPLTDEGVRSIPLPLLNKLNRAWTVAMAEVPDPLGRQSRNGASSEEASLGMASSSESLGNWPTPS